MPTHVALLRGINVGGNNRVPMATLRDLVTSVGATDVATYIQSGNVVFTADGKSATGLASRLEAAIADALGLRIHVVVLSREELADAVAANPYPEVADPKHLHLGFGVGGGADVEKAVTDATEAARAKGSRDEARMVDGVLYLRTPEGLGRSDLAARLGRIGGRGRDAAGTMRNWATVTKLLALCDA